MNPFSKFLRQWSRQPDFDHFVEQWDRLERLVIAVYKAGQARPEDEQTYAEVRTWLGQHYGRWSEALRPHWQEALIGGAPAVEDPFLRLTRPENAAAFVGDWQAMQHLPAAREAINRLLLAE